MLLGRSVHFLTDAPTGDFLIELTKLNNQPPHNLALQAEVLKFWHHQQQPLTFHQYLGVFWLTH